MQVICRYQFILGFIPPNPRFGALFKNMGMYVLMYCYTTTGGNYIISNDGWMMSFYIFLDNSLFYFCSTYLGVPNI